MPDAKMLPRIKEQFRRAEIMVKQELAALDTNDPNYEFKKFTVLRFAQVKKIIILRGYGVIKKNIFDLPS